MTTITPIQRPRQDHRREIPGLYAHLTLCRSLLGFGSRSSIRRRFKRPNRIHSRYRHRMSRAVDQRIMWFTTECLMRHGGTTPHRLALSAERANPSPGRAVLTEAALSDAYPHPRYMRIARDRPFRPTRAIHNNPTSPSGACTRTQIAPPSIGSDILGCLCGKVLPASRARQSEPGV
jgi:hypothetical protein